MSNAYSEGMMFLIRYVVKTRTEMNGKNIRIYVCLIDVINRADQIEQLPNMIMNIF